MSFFVEVEGSFSGSKVFTEIDCAREYYQFLLIGLEYTNDFSTNVYFKQIDKSGKEQLLVKRINGGGVIKRSWLNDFLGG